MPTVPRPRRPRLLRAFGGLLATAGLALGAALAGAPTAAHAASGGYVALGDSYSSGTGTGTYYSDGTDCLRSPKAYGPLLAAREGRTLTFAACSGATTADVLSQQVAALQPDTTLVTMTIGGNDVGFVPVLTECAKPSWWGNCDKAIDGALSIATGQLPGRLANLYSQIRQRSPQATVVVAGYPHIFNGQDCSILTFFSAKEMSRLNAAGDQLNSVIRQATVAAGMRYVDPVASFAGHAVCDSSEWINGLSWPIVESFHPNAAGHQAYAAVFAPVTSTSRAATSARTLDAGRTAAPTLPAARGRSERVTAPDLSSAAAVSAARRAGISDSDLAALQEAQRRGASNATLERLSEQAVRR